MFSCTMIFEHRRFWVFLAASWMMIACLVLPKAGAHTLRTDRAVELDENDWQTAQMTDRDDRLVFEIRIIGMEQLSVETRGFQADPLCILYDEDGRELARDDDDGSGQNCALTAQVPSDTYYLEVRPSNSTGLGSFTVRYQTQSLSSDRQYGRSRSRAVEIDDGDTLRATMTARAEQWYELDLDGDERAEVHIEGLNDLRCVITDDDGDVVAHGDSRGDVCEVEADGASTERYLKVTGENSRVVGTYTVHFEQERIADDHGDRSSNATRLSSWDREDGHLTPGDVDVFRIRPDKGDDIEVKTEGNIDTECVLLNGDGDKIDEDDDGGFGDNCRLEFKAQYDEYFVTIRGASRSVSGAYRVSWDD